MWWFNSAIRRNRSAGTVGISVARYCGLSLATVPCRPRRLIRSSRRIGSTNNSRSRVLSG
jgi:hypothetical protein